MSYRRATHVAVAVLATCLLENTALAQTSSPATATPDSLAVYFDTGSAAIRPQDVAVLDQASRIYTDGKPTVMILTATTDAVGSPIRNLRLSQQRALAVVNQLVARGIPAERFQILAKGLTDPTVPDPPGTPEPRDRRVDIGWR